MKDQGISNNTVTYSMECKGKDSVVLISGKMTYNGDILDGSSTTDYKGKGHPEMQMMNKISGKYIGPCPK
jgi:2',3'-cyclic-nucleotide 2'-phosphodiesterase (5'-nucleotidase family)